MASGGKAPFTTIVHKFSPRPPDGRRGPPAIGIWCLLMDVIKERHPKLVVVPENILCCTRTMNKNFHVLYRDIEAYLDINMVYLTQVLTWTLSHKKDLLLFDTTSYLNVIKKKPLSWFSKKYFKMHLWHVKTCVKTFTVMTYNVIKIFTLIKYL